MRCWDTAFFGSTVMYSSQLKEHVSLQKYVIWLGYGMGLLHWPFTARIFSVMQFHSEFWWPQSRFFHSWSLLCWDFFLDANILAWYLSWVCSSRYKWWHQDQGSSRSGLLFCHYMMVQFLEAANTYPNGFVTETGSKMYMKNRGEEMDQKREAKKMGVQKERKIDK